MAPDPRQRRFHPDAARYAELAAEAIGARFVDLDDGGGYLFAVEHGGRRVVSGAGSVCSYPVNSAAAHGISRDKAHAKRVLADQGVPVVGGEVFFRDLSRVALRAPGREVADAFVFARRLGFPVFCKPNAGSRGDHAEIVPEPAGLEAYLARLPARYDAFLIEPVLTGDEYRVLVHDGRPVYHALKSPPALVGDGHRTVAELLGELNAGLAGSGVSPVPLSAALASGFGAEDRPPAGARVPLAGRRNLEAGGGVEHLALGAPEALAGIARRACRAIGLRVGAVDLFDTSRDLSGLVVIEVNGNPNLRALESAGHLDAIRALWTGMLREELGL